MAKGKEQKPAAKRKKAATVEQEQTMTTTEPQDLPPDEGSMDSAAENSPTDLPPSEIESDEAATGSDESPTEGPPDEEVASVEGYGANWHKNKKITALWGINQNRNSWVHVSGLGWKKLANNSNSAIVALTMLGAHAKQGNRKVNVKEDGGQVKELYVW